MSFQNESICCSCYIQIILHASSFRDNYWSENNRFVLLCVGQNHYIFNAGLSFDELGKYLFTIHDVTAFLSNRLSQDPLEEVFGMQRGEEYTTTQMLQSFIYSIMPSLHTAPVFDRVLHPQELPWLVQFLPAEYDKTKSSPRVVESCYRFCLCTARVGFEVHPSTCFWITIPLVQCVIPLPKWVCSDSNDYPSKTLQTHVADSYFGGDRHHQFLLWSWLSFAIACSWPFNIPWPNLVRIDTISVDPVRFLTS